MENYILNPLSIIAICSLKINSPSDAMKRYHLGIITELANHSFY